MTQEALAKLRTLRPDVIVTDLMMPHMNGDQLVKALRADPAYAETPILVLSARAEEATRLDVLRSGASDYVTKPFSAAELRARASSSSARCMTRRAAFASAGPSLVWPSPRS